MVETILEAAARVFVKEGYAKATTNRIAQAAHVSVGSLYQYFPSKDAVAVELLRRYRMQLLGSIASRLETAERATFSRVVRDLLTDLLRSQGIDSALQRVLIEQVLRTHARREMLGFEEQLEALIVRALETADLRDGQRETVAFVLVRAVLSVIQSALVDRPQLNTHALVEELTRLVVSYVGT